MFDDLFDLIQQGEQLSPAEVSRLEQHLQFKPDDIPTRVKLLGYYCKEMFSPAAKRARAEHILWFAQHRPDHPILGSPYGMLHPPIDGEAYRKVRDVLLSQAQRNPRNVQILANASEFLSLYDRRNAIALAQQAMNLQPNNPDHALRLAKLYELTARSAKDEPTRQRYYEMALHTIESALSRSGNISVHRLALITEAADLAARAKQWQKAKRYAQQLLRTPSIPLISRRPDADARHVAHIVLGKVALAQGDVKSARRHLLEAAKVEGSPVLSSFGPDFSLARALLQRGERQVVLEYLDLCEKFWLSGKNLLNRYRQAIREGRIPDFDFRGE